MADQLSADLAALKIDRTNGPPGRSPIKIIAGLLVVGGLLATGYVFGLPALEAKVFKTEVEVTEVAQVSPAQAAVELTSSGYVVPQSTSKVAAKVPGKVSKIYVKQGDTVKAGDVLYEIDPSDQNASIAIAQSQVAAAKARVLTARANLAEAKQQAQRDATLAAQGVAPKANADDRAARVAALEEAVKAAEAEVKAAAAQVNALNVNLVNFTVKTPISGTIINKPPEVGEFVGPQPAGIAADMGGAEVADFSTLMVETDVPEQRLGQIKIGGPAEIVLDAFPSRRYRGRAAEITPKVNRAKASVTVKVAFVDDNTGVLPEMAARVSFLASELDEKAIKTPPKTIVPGAAVAELNGAKVVYVIEDGKVRVVPVSLGPAFGSGFELIKGPSPGTRLVKSPPAGLADGQRVKEKADS